MNNPFKGFKFQVIKRAITVKNANSLGRFEQRGMPEYKPEYVYQDTPVDGSDFITNASKSATNHRLSTTQKNIVYFVVETETNKTVL